MIGNHRPVAFVIAHYKTGYKPEQIGQVAHTRSLYHRTIDHSNRCRRLLLGFCHSGCGQNKGRIVEKAVRAVDFLCG